MLSYASLLPTVVIIAYIRGQISLLGEKDVLNARENGFVSGAYTVAMIFSGTIDLRFPVLPLLAFLRC